MSNENQTADLYNKYKEKGFQKMSLSEYENLRRGKSKKKSQFKIPTPVKFILSTPLLIVFCCGIFFLPYILYVVATSPSKPSHADQKDTGSTVSDDKNVSHQK